MYARNAESQRQVSRMDRKEAIEILKKNKPTSDPRRCGIELCEAVDIAIEALQEPEIVHCKDCRHWDKEIMYCNHTGMQIEPDGYCVYGERKE